MNKPAQEVVDGSDISAVIVQRPIAELGFSVRAYNCLTRAKKYVVGDLLATTVIEYMDIPKFGGKCFIEVVEKLEQLGLTVKDWPGSLEAALAPYCGPKKRRSLLGR